MEAGRGAAGSGGGGSLGVETKRARAERRGPFRLCSQVLALEAELLLGVGGDDCGWGMN